eukprot:scaffold141437_cov24-Tisochrysis_lutea.AAC.1
MACTVAVFRMAGNPRCCPRSCPRHWAKQIVQASLFLSAGLQCKWVLTKQSHHALLYSCPGWVTLAGCSLRGVQRSRLLMGLAIVPHNRALKGLTLTGFCSIAEDWSLDRELQGLCLDRSLHGPENNECPINWVWMYSLEKDNNNNNRY